MLSTCFFLALALGTLVLILGFTYQNKILLLLGANEEILPYSEQYCRYILLAAPFMATSFVLNQCLRAEGSAVFSMIGMVAGAVLNVGLDPLFIFTFGWGVAGASAATAISKVVSWCILMTPYFRKKTLLTIRFRQFRPRWSDAKEVCAMGSASFFRNGLGTLAGILLNRIAVGYGTSALAAINVANRITMFMTSACLGFGQGFQPVAGYNFGAGSKPRTRQAFWFSTLFGTVVCVAGAALIALFPEPIMHFFRDDPEVTRIGRQALLYACAVMPVMAYSTYVNQLYQCLGFHQAATLLASCRNGLLYVPLIVLLPGLLGLSGVAMSQPAADFLTFLVSIPFQIWFFRHKLRG